MQNSVWKLSALAGVVVVGFLVVLQTQFGLTRTAEELQAGPTPGKGAKPSADDSGKLFPSSHLGLAGQTEPSPDAPASEQPAPPQPEQKEPVVFRKAPTGTETVSHKSAEQQPAERQPADLQTAKRQPLENNTPAPMNVQPGPGAVSPFETQSAEKTAAPAKTPTAPPKQSDSGPRFAAFGNVTETRSEKQPGTSVAAEPAATTQNTTQQNNTPKSAESKPGSPIGTPTRGSQESATGQEKSPFADKAAATPPAKSNAGSPFDAPPASNPFGGGQKQPPVERKTPQPADNPFGTPPAATKENNPFPKNDKADADRFNRKNQFGAPENKRAPEPKSAAAQKSAPESKAPPNAQADTGPKFGSGQPEPRQQTPKAVPLTGSPFDNAKPETAPAKNSEPQPGQSAPVTPAPAPARSPADSPKTSAQPPAFGNGQESKPAPNRLQPSPEAAQLKPAKNDTLQGDGTVGKNAPRGQQRAQLTIEKIAPKTATLNKPFVYDIVIKNVGASSASQVVVEDRIPKGSRLTGTAPQAVLAGKTLRWKLGTLSPGASKKISVRIIPITAGQVGSVATVNFVSEVAAATLIAPPKVDLKFTGPKKAKVGDAVPFQFVVTNKGTTIANDVWIRDIVPDGLSHPAGRDIEYEIGVMKPGESKTIDLTMKAVKAGTATNRGIVTVGKNIRIESKVAVEIESTRLVISRTGPKRRYVGRAAVYTNMVTNSSTQRVNGAKLTEVIPAGMEFVEASGGGQYDPARRLVAWDVGALGPNQSRTFRVKLMPKKTGAQNSIVRAHTTDGGIIQAKSETAVDGYELLGLDVASLDRPMEVGEQVTLRIVASNRGTMSAANVQIGLKLPAEFKLVAVRGRGTYTEKGQIVTFSALPNVAAGGRAAYEIVVKALKPGDTRIGVQIQSKSMQRPLNREEAIRIVPANR